MPFDLNNIDLNKVQDPLIEPVDISQTEEVTSDLQLQTPMLEPDDTVRSNLTEAVKVNPDQHAEALKTSRATGVPVQAVDDSVKQKFSLDKIDLKSLEEKNPKTSAFLRDPNNAIVSQDDTGILADLEDIFDWSKTFAGFAESAKLAFKKQTAGLALYSAQENMPESVADIFIKAQQYTPLGVITETAKNAEKISEKITGVKFGPAEFQRRLTAGVAKYISPEISDTDRKIRAVREESIKRLTEQVTEYAKQQEAIAPKDLNLLEQGVRGGVDSLVNMIPGMTLTLLSRGKAAPMLLTMGIQTFGDSFGEGISAGMNPDTAKLYAGIQGGIEIATEVLPMKTVEKMLTGKSGGLTKKALQFFTREMIGEQIATLGQSLTDYSFGLDKRLEQASSVQEMLQIQAERQIVTAFATIVAGGGQIGIFTGARKTIDMVQQRANNNKIKSSIEGQKLDALNESVLRSNTHKRDKEVFKQFIENADGENNTHVHIDAAQTKLYLQQFTQDQINNDPALKDLQDKVAEAAAEGNDISMPVGEFSVQIAGTEHFEALRPAMTIGEDTVAPFRQAQAVQEIDNYVKRQMDEAQVNAQEYQQAQDVYDRVKQSLIESGVVTPQNASIMAQIVPAWAASKAKREGKTIQQVYAEGGLRIEGPYQEQVEPSFMQEPAYKDAPIIFENMRDTFLEALPEDASVEDVMDSLDQFTPEQQQFLKQMDKNDWLGYDYPSQAINDILSPEPGEHEISQGLKQSLGRMINKAFGQQPVSDLKANMNIPEEGIIIGENLTGEDFHAAITSAVEANKKGAAVHVYPASDYDNMSVFTFDEGRVGFAIEPDGNLVSVFKDPASEVKGALDLIVPEAIRRGATKLDAFEGFLTKSYAKYGFEVVERIPWDDKYMPEGWDKETMGTPDVLVMELNYDKYNQYIAKTGVKPIQDLRGVQRRYDPLGISAEVFAQGATTGREEDGSLGGLPRIRGAAANLEITRVAEEYMKSAGMEYNPPSNYIPVDVAFAERVAKAYADMKHDPNNPEVQRAYQQLAKETAAQYQAAIDAGLKVEFIDYEKQGDPYGNNPRMAIEDINENNHLWVFSTRDGFGTDDTFDPTGNPLLEETDFEISGQKALVNDLFRVVHDYFGHAKEGVGFRANGEENAFRAHSAMFSPLAQRALASETRGQNSWLNFGPYGVTNRTAKSEDTIFADQKTGLMPLWATTVSDEIFEQALTLRTGQETLQKYGLDPTKTHTTRQVAAALEARQREIYGKIEPTDRSDEARDKIAQWMVAEIEFELENPENSGVGWYSEKFQNAIDVFATEFPELKDDQQARNTFTALIAITSDGQKVLGNFRMAEDIYRNFRETGKFTTSRVTQRQANINNNLTIIQHLYDTMGAETMHNYLMEEMTVGELKKIARENGIDFTTSYKVDVVMPRAALVLGPKLGAFYANLMGAHGYLTMDRWWSRTFNRYRGTLLPRVTGLTGAETDTKGRKIGLAKFKEMIGKPNISDDEALAETVAPWKSYKDRGYKNGTPIEKLANTIHKAAFDEIKDVPFNASDRSFMLDTVDKAAEILAQKGNEVSVADIQAILWYYEKKLYGELGTRQPEGISYEEAAQQVISDRTGGQLAQGGLGEAVDPGEQIFGQSAKARGYYDPANSIIRLTQASDLSTFLHEFAHFMFEMETKGDTPILRQINSWFKRNAQDVADEANSYLGKEFDSLKQAAYHGSPHTFTQFDMSAIGTGEGNQTFGWGMYFAENPEIAESYKDETGNLYEVEIPDEHVKNFLNWNKTLREQPHIAKMLDITDSKLPNRLTLDMTGQEVYDRLSRGLTNRGVIGKENASKYLDSLGIKGIKYLDATDKSNNLVVFDPNIIDVIKRNEQLILKSLRSQAGFTPEMEAQIAREAEQKTAAGEIPAMFKEQLTQAGRPPAQEGDITTDDVEAFLENKTTGDQSKDAAIRRAVHEQFARGFEQYLMEGKAPSVELRNVFRTIARWLTKIYQSLKGRLSVNLDDEMRAVFDRMVATDEQIAMAEARNQYEPMFTDATTAGMTEKEYKDYLARQEKVKDKQTETLRDKLIKELTRQTQKWWKEEKSDVYDEAINELKKERVYVARDRLKNGDIKLDHAEVKEVYGNEVTNKLGRKAVVVPRPLAGMTKKGGEGVRIDDAAAFLGYSSGSEMINDLITAPSLKDAGNAMAEATMVERHGDILNDGTIEQEADEAIQNEERGKLILSELKILSKGTSIPTIDRQIIKEMAIDKIGKLSFRDNHPGKYRKAEIRWAQESARKLQAGDKAGAADAKLKQVINYYLGMESTKAKNDTVKIVDRMNRYSKKKIRERIIRAENGYMDQIDNILNRFEFRKSVSLKRVDSINLWMKERIDQDGDGLVLDNAVLSEGYITHWKNVPYSDLVGINDSVKNIEHVARYADKVRMQQEERDFKEFKQRWIDNIVANGQKFETKESRSRIDDSRKATKMEHIQKWISQLTKVPFLASWLDGGERAGLSHDVLVQPFTDALDNKFRLFEVVAQPVLDAINKRSKEDVKRHNQKIWIPEIEDNLMGHQILAVALNTGNQGNLKKMLLGEGWATPEDETTISIDNPQLQAVLRYMTKSDWDLVQKIWDQMEKLYPMLAEVHRKTTGLTPPKIQAIPVKTEYGEYKGGYYPMKYSSQRSHKAEKNAEKSAAEAESMFSNTSSIQASVNAGATNERTGFYDRVKLSLDVVPEHFQEVIHFITHHEAVRQTNRLINSPDVANAITGSVGEEEFKRLKPWLNDIAKDGRNQPVKTFIDEMIGRLRFGTTLGVMGFKASTGIMQTFGLLTTAAEVGPGQTIKAIYTTLGRSHYLNAVRKIFGSTDDIQSVWQFASERSKVMNHRMKTMDREIKNALTRLQGKAGVISAVQEASMKHIALIQTYMVDLPTWLAAYNKELGDSGDEVKAIKYADWAVESLQGSGATKDMATLYRNQNKVFSTLTMFMTYFSSLNQLIRDTARGARSRQYSATTVAAKFMFLMALPVFLEMLMRGEFGADDEPEEKMAKMLTNLALYPINTVPFVRDVASGVLGDYGYQASPVFSMIEKGITGSATLAKQVYNDEEISKSAAKNSSKVVGAAFAIPGINQAWSTGEHLYDVIEEGEDLTLRELIYGPDRNK